MMFKILFLMILSMIGINSVKSTTQLFNIEEPRKARPHITILEDHVLSISSETDISQVILVINGNQVYNQSGSFGKTYQIDMSSFSSGDYTLELNNGFWEYTHFHYPG